VYCSTDGGLSWTAHRKGWGNPPVSCLVWDPHELATLWAATNDGVWRYEFGTPEELDLANAELFAPLPTQMGETLPTPTNHTGSAALPELELTVVATLLPTITPTSQVLERSERTPAPSPVVTETPTRTLPPTATPTATHTPTPSATQSPISTLTSTPLPPAPTLPPSPVPPEPTAVPVSPTATPKPR
jgi:hypothetical protein